MSQTEIPLTDIYATVLDFTTDPSDRIVQGRTRKLRIAFGNSPLETTDKFSLPLRDDWSSPDAYRTLYSSSFAVVEEEEAKFLEIAFMGDETSKWPLNGAAVHHIRELSGILNHHAQDGAEREHSGNVLIKLAFIHTWDRL